MAERYTRLYLSEEALYKETSPVVIAAGALLKDNQTGKILAQIKFRSISKQDIKAIKVKIQPLDTVGHLLGETVDYQYLDLNIRRDEEFGQKTPVAMPDSSTRAFRAEVTEVAFTDNTLWKTDGAAWETMEPPEKLESVLGDRELYEQYKLDISKQALVKPRIYRDLWYCTCGAENHEEEENCHSCGNSKEKLFTVDLDVLRERANERLYALAEGKMRENTVDSYRKAAEILRSLNGWKDSAELAEDCEKRRTDLAAAEEAERQEKIRKEKDKAESAKKKRKKAFAVTGIILGILVLCAVTAKVLVTYIIPNNKYNKATKLMEEGSYAEAAELFEKLDEYKDSKIEADYCKANNYFEERDYKAAKNIFMMLGDFKDSEEREEQSKEAEKQDKYDRAKELFEAQEYAKAQNLYLAIRDYKDSEKQAELCADKIAEQQYLSAVDLYDKGEYKKAQDIFVNMPLYEDTKTYLQKLAKELGKNSILYMGRYLQSESSAGSEEDIQWKVITVEGNRALLVSEKILDCKPYNTVYTNTTWEKSSIRSWLNNSFYNNAFTDDEKRLILETDIKPEKDTIYDTYGDLGNATQDHVFLLSRNEMNKYNIKYNCTTTQYAGNQGARHET